MQGVGWGEKKLNYFLVAPLSGVLTCTRFAPPIPSFDVVVIGLDLVKAPRHTGLSFSIADCCEISLCGERKQGEEK